MIVSHVTLVLLWLGVPAHSGVWAQCFYLLLFMFQASPDHLEQCFFFSPKEGVCLYGTEAQIQSMAKPWLLWFGRRQTASPALQPSWESWRPPGAGQQLQVLGSSLQLELPSRNPKCSLGILNCSLSPIQIQKKKALYKGIEVRLKEPKTILCEILVARFF